MTTITNKTTPVTTPPASLKATVQAMSGMFVSSAMLQSAQAICNSGVSYFNMCGYRISASTEIQHTVVPVPPHSSKNVATPVTVTPAFSPMNGTWDAAGIQPCTVFSQSPLFSSSSIPGSTAGTHPVAPYASGWGLSGTSAPTWGGLRAGNVYPNSSFASGFPGVKAWLAQYPGGNVIPPDGSWPAPIFKAPVATDASGGTLSGFIKSYYFAQCASGAIPFPRPSDTWPNIVTGASPYAMPAWMNTLTVAQISAFDVFPRYWLNLWAQTQAEADAANTYVTASQQSIAGVQMAAEQQANSGTSPLDFALVVGSIIAAPYLTAALTSSASVATGAMVTDGTTAALTESQVSAFTVATTDTAATATVSAAATTSLGSASSIIDAATTAAISGSSAAVSSSALAAAGLDLSGNSIVDAATVAATGSTIAGTDAAMTQLVTSETAGPSATAITPTTTNAGISGAAISSAPQTSLLSSLQDLSNSVPSPLQNAATKITGAPVGAITSAINGDVTGLAVAGESAAIKSVIGPTAPTAPTAPTGPTNYVIPPPGLATNDFFLYALAGLAGLGLIIASR